MSRGLLGCALLGLDEPARCATLASSAPVEDGNAFRSRQRTADEAATARAGCASRCSDAASCLGYSLLLEPPTGGLAAPTSCWLYSRMAGEQLIEAQSVVCAKER